MPLKLKTLNIMLIIQKNRLKKTARYFLASNDIQDRPCRFDIVTIVLGRTGRPQIRHYENAFVP